LQEVNRRLPEHRKTTRPIRQTTGPATGTRLAPDAAPARKREHPHFQARKKSIKKRRLPERIRKIFILSTGSRDLPMRQARLAIGAIIRRFDIKYLISYALQN
jgi:hypothetical protein